MEKLLTDKILEELGLIPTELAIKIHNITFFDLIFSLIKGGSINNASKLLNITDNILEHQIRRNLKQYLPSKATTTPWDIVLLATVDHKRCSKCKEIKLLELFGSRSECKECSNIIQKEKHKLNPEYGNFRSKIHYLNNRETYIAKAIQRKTRRKIATPLWADLNKIKEIYNNCPKGYHVDHIIPLQGDLVSGLHVENNLQYLTVEDNLKKSNKFMDQLAESA